MEKAIDERLSGFLFVVILPFLLFFMSYYGFESSYVGLKSMEKAPDFMFSSVYAYRIIPNFLMTEVSHAMEFFVNNYLSFLKSFLLKNGTLFYHSIFLINAVFFILSSIILNKILNFKLSPNFDKNMSRIIHLLAIFFIVMAQYVPTNCDLIAVFFYLSGVWLTLKYCHDRKPFYFVMICLIIMISTFVRETSCLNIAFYAAFFIDFKKLKDSKIIGQIMLLVLSFVVPYLFLKIMIPQDVSFFEGFYVAKNFTSPFNIAGLLFGVLGFYFVYRLGNFKQKQILKKYIFFSLPYLIMITLVGLFWETRLFLPLLLTGIVVASHQFKLYTE